MHLNIIDTFVGNLHHSEHFNDAWPFNIRAQVSTAQKTWMSVSCPQMPAKMVAHVTIQWVASTACVWMVGQAMTAARTLMTAPVQPATKEPHATTASHHSTASAHMGAPVSVWGCVWLYTENAAANPMHSPINFLFCYIFSGLLCHLDDACISNPCQKGSNCDTNPVNGMAICTCPPGYTGSACNQDIDECSLGNSQSLHSLLGRDSNCRWLTVDQNDMVQVFLTETWKNMHFGKLTWC